ncbi:MAG: threonine aldolase family protein [Lachnospiraceae bacterium]
MIRFNSDYLEGAHPQILQKLAETNREQTAGYGEDPYCKQAAELIRTLCRKPDAKVHFLVGGTLTNTIAITAVLRPHQGVISAASGHINVHETGSIEARGHKILALPSTDGKITASQIAEIVKLHREDDSHEHLVQPKMVYISNPTEFGTIYKRHELEEISRTCRKNGLILFLDGARLGYGLACRENDLDLPSIASFCDMFYIGGTKVGALFGEALVICSQQLQEDFRYMIKQQGGMLAKGRLLGLQFLALFEDALYFQISAHAVVLADKLRNSMEEMGIRFAYDSPTNQLFPILKNTQIEKLGEHISFLSIEKIDNTHTCIRFCTSWATKEEDVDTLIQVLKSIKN